MHKDMLDEIKEMGYVPSLFIHACCAPCSTHVIDYLSEYFYITIYYYNPNIYPEAEYSRRLEELKELLKVFPTKRPVKFIEANYNQVEYDAAVAGFEEKGEKSERCYRCYRLRMEEAVRYANGKYDYFTITLSISPHKNSEWIERIGKNLESEYDIRYLNIDFKKNDGYKKAVDFSKEYGLYRQDYCGCKYSKEKK